MDVHKIAMISLYLQKSFCLQWGTEMAGLHIVVMDFEGLDNEQRSLLATSWATYERGQRRPIPYMQTEV